MDLNAATISPAVSASIAAGQPTSKARAGTEAAHKAAQDFESFFLSQTFDTMFSGVGNDTMFGGGEGERIYRSLLLQEYSKVAAKSGGIGIADAVQREMLRLQEGK